MEKEELLKIINDGISRGAKFRLTLSEFYKQYLSTLGINSNCLKSGRLRKYCKAGVIPPSACEFSNKHWFITDPGAALIAFIDRPKMGRPIEEDAQPNSIARRGKRKKMAERG